MKKKILFIFLLIAFLASPVLASKIWEGKNFQSASNTAKENYTEALNSYQKAREDYLSAVNKYKSQCKEETEKCKELKEQAISKTKQYLLKIKDAMAKYLTFLESNIENFEGANKEDKSKIEDEISLSLRTLDDKEAEIERLQTVEEIKNFTQNLRTFWGDAEAKIKKYIGSLIIWKLEAVYSKLDEVAGKIQEKINEYNKEGFDTFEVQKFSSEAKDKLKTAKTKIDEAKTLFSDPAKFSEGKTKAKEAAKLMKDVFSDLRSLAGKLKNKNDFKKKEVSGKGKISIKGEGFVSLTGSGEIYGKIGDEKSTGVLTISDKAGDIQIETFSKGERADLGDGRIQYKGVGQIKIKGSNIVVEISSQFIDIEAEGKGQVVMRGDGLYKTSKSDWTDISKTDIKIDL